MGLTGGIGSGKSTVAGMMAERGAHVIDADRLAREAVSVGSPGLQAVIDHFGSEFLLPDGSLDRARLGRRVFADRQARSALNAIVHPEVRRLAARAFAEAEAAGVSWMVYDVPLLFENGMEGDFDQVIVVRVRPELQRARVVQRDGLTPEEARARIGAQMPLEEKAARAHAVFDNDGDLEDLRAQVDAWVVDMGLQASEEETR